MNTANDDTIATLTQLLAKTLARPVQIAAEADFVSDLQLESVQVMEFVVEVEDHYDIAIDLESLSNVRTLWQLAKVVTRTTGAAT